MIVRHLSAFRTRHSLMVEMGLMLAIVIGVVFALHQWTAYNMDEFLALQVRNLRMLAVWGTSFHLPLLTYSYVGSVHALLYWPLYLLWPSPISARLFGGLFLIAQAVIHSRLFR